MCTVETGTTTVSTSSNETTKYSCQDNAERGWIISCVYRCVCMYVCVYQRRHGLRGGQGSKTAYIGNTIHSLYSLLIEETRGFLKRASGGGGTKEGCVREGWWTVTMLVDFDGGSVFSVYLHRSRHLEIIWKVFRGELWIISTRRVFPFFFQRNFILRVDCRFLLV